MALDISTPTKPVPLNSTNEEGVENDDRDKSPYNNFILHNSFRPNAKMFKSFSQPKLSNGNVLLATEEDTGAGACGPELGSFQTWKIPHLSATRYRNQNPGLEAGGGSISPVDMCIRRTPQSVPTARLTTSIITTPGARSAQRGRGRRGVRRAGLVRVRHADARCP